MLDLSVLNRLSVLDGPDPQAGARAARAVLADLRGQGQNFALLWETLERAGLPLPLDIRSALSALDTVDQENGPKIVSVVRTRMARRGLSFARLAKTFAGPSDPSTIQPFSPPPPPRPSPSGSTRAGTPQRARQVQKPKNTTPPVSSPRGRAQTTPPPRWPLSPEKTARLVVRGLLLSLFVAGAFLFEAPKGLEDKLIAAVKASLTTDPAPSPARRAVPLRGASGAAPL